MGLNWRSRREIWGSQWASRTMSRTSYSRGIIRNLVMARRWCKLNAKIRLDRPGISFLDSIPHSNLLPVQCSRCPLRARSPGLSRKPSVPTMGLYPLDYGAGNVQSLANTLKKLGYDFQWISSPADFHKATVSYMHSLVSCIDHSCRAGMHN